MTVSFVPSASRRPDGAWVCQAVGSDGTEAAEVIRDCTTRQAWEKATGLAQLMSLREALRTKRELGHALLDNPAMIRGKGGGLLTPFVEALDTVECFGDGRHRDVLAFRSGDDGTGERKRRSDSRFAVSPWQRAPSTRDRDFLAKLARAFPEYPWPAELR